MAEENRPHEFDRILEWIKGDVKGEDGDLFCILCEDEPPFCFSCFKRREELNHPSLKWRFPDA